jgi:hypothetical protein
MNKLTDFIKQLFKDKANNYSLRELVIFICLLLIISAWIAQLWFGVTIPEHMFYAVTGLIASGCFGYSIEKHPNTERKEED